VEPGAVLAISVAYGAEQILAVYNLAGSPQDARLELSGWQGARLVDLFSGADLPAISGDRYTLELQPYQYVWLQTSMI